jgi:hypothetical protein
MVTCRGGAAEASLGNPLFTIAMESDLLLLFV